MPKKSFKDINPAMDFISVQEAHGTQEARKVQDAPRRPLSASSQGKKGQKLPRINMAFATSNLEYLRLISRIEGISITEYINRLIQADRDKRQGILEEAKKLLRTKEG